MIKNRILNKGFIVNQELLLGFMIKMEETSVYNQFKLKRENFIPIWGLIKYSFVKQKNQDAHFDELSLKEKMKAVGNLGILGIYNTMLAKGTYLLFKSGLELIVK